MLKQREDAWTNPGFLTLAENILTIKKSLSGSDCIILHNPTATYGVQSHIKQILTFLRHWLPPRIWAALSRDS